MIHLALEFQTPADIMDQGLLSKTTFAGECSGRCEGDKFALMLGSKSCPYRNESSRLTAYALLALSFRGNLTHNLIP